MREVLQSIAQLSVHDVVLSSILAVGLCLTIAQMMASRRKPRKVRVVVSKRERGDCLRLKPPG